MHIQMTPYSFYIFHVFLYENFHCRFTWRKMPVSVYHKTNGSTLKHNFCLVPGTIFFSTVVLAVLTNLNRLVLKREEHIIFNPF